MINQRNTLKKELLINHKLYRHYENNKQIFALILIY